MLTAFGGAAVLQGISTAVRSLADFEFAMDKVEAISGATGESLEALKKNALDLGRTTKFTATEIATLQLELSKLGFSSEKIIASTDAIRKLATVADEDLGESAKTLAGTLNSFNLEASESERVANTMAESFSKSALTLEKFTVATANSGAIANALGVTLESNTARIGALVDANIDASKAGTDLRKIYVDLNKEGITYDQALDMVAKSSDKVATATELVGLRASGALVILANQREKVDNLTKSLKDNNKELDSMVDTMEDNLLTDWKKFTSSIDGLVQKGSGAVKILRSITQAFTEANNELAKTDLERRLEPINKQIKLLGNTQGTIDTLSVIIKKYELALSDAKEELQKSVDKGWLYSGIAKKQQDGIEALTATIDIYKNKVKLSTDAIKAEADATALSTVELRLKNAELEKQAKILNTGLGLQGIKGLSAPSLGNGSVDPLGGLNVDQILGRKAEDDYSKMLSEKWDNIIAINKEKGEELRFINEGLQQTLAASFTSVFDSIGNSLGGGGETFRDGFSKFANILGQGMQAVGSAMIAWGVAQEAFQKSLQSLNPYVAIAAGGALSLLVLL